MKKLLISVIAALALAGCTAAQLAENGARVAAATADAVGVAPPASVTDQTVLDEQAALAAELAYKAARLAVETGVDAGVITGATAARIAELDQRAYLALAVVRQAYSAGSAVSYSQALTSARAAITDLMAIAKKES